MKSTILLLACLLLCIAPAMAQLTETEPNNSYTAANPLPLNTTMTGVTCNITPGGPDWFRIVLPTDGHMKLRCSVSCNIQNAAAGSFGVTLFSRTNVPFYSFYPQLSSSGTAVTDSFIFASLAADTFYIQVTNGYASATNICFTYSFSCSLTPATFASDAEPNYSPNNSIPIAYNTPAEGHLSFFKEPVYSYDADDYYTIVTPTDGVLRVITETEAYTPGDNRMDVIAYGKSNVQIGNSQIATPGAFGHPHTDTFYWQCISKDTFHIGLQSNAHFNGGYAYRLHYDMIQPLFAADGEPNNTYASARVVNPNNTIEGHQYFYGAGDNDYYKFYKPDTGFLKIYMKAETWSAAANQTYVVRLETKNQGYIMNASPHIGANSQPSLDSIVIASLPADSFYLSVQNSSIFQPCMSYQMKIRSAGITGLAVPEVVNSRFGIYPNPSKGSFSISSSIHITAIVQVYNIYGQSLYSQRMDLPSAKEVRLENAASGIYYVAVVTADGQRWLQKLLLQ